MTSIVVTPIVAVIWLALFPTENIWPHLLETVLPTYVQSTLLLLFGVGVGTLIIGVGTAWLISMCEFPGRAIVEWLLVLPLAMPGYVAAYVYTDLLEFAGPVQQTLRTIFGWHTMRDYWFPEIRSLSGAIAVLTFTLYPYVYLLARSAFLEQTGGIVEAARTLGCNRWSTLYRVSLPMARPAVVVGLALVMMESLNDFGTVDYFAVDTLTAGLFNVWLTMNNTGGGAQIALVMLLFVVLLLLAERRSRRARRYYDSTQRCQETRLHRLSSVNGFGALLACLLPITAGFLIPAGLLLSYAVEAWDISIANRYPEAALNSIMLSAGAAAIAVAVGLFLAYAVRISNNRGLQGLVRSASLGYAVPGAVLAIGILAPFGALDNLVDSLARNTLGIGTGLILSGTVFAILFAYVVRFLALSYNTLEAGLGRITPSVSDAARTLKHSPAKALIRVNLPILQRSIFTAALLIFVDCMKELPATLLLRPFNFDTLATYVYQFASDELLEEAALGAITIVMAGVLPVILLTRVMNRRKSLQTAVPAGP